MLAPILLLALAAVAGANEAHDWVIRDGALRCAANEFLDTIELACMPCSVMGDDVSGVHLIGDARHVDEYGNARSCRCPVGFTQTTEECADEAGTDAHVPVLEMRGVPRHVPLTRSNCTKVFVAPRTSGWSAGTASQRGQKHLRGPERPIYHLIDTHVSGQFYKASPYECQAAPRW